MKNISPKVVIVAVVALALIVGGVIYWNSQKQPVKNAAVEEATNATEKMVEDATKGTLPSLQTNPLESKPDLNPADEANPFKNIKTNPFE